MNAIIRFLQAARSLKNSGITKEQVLEFAKREFGEVSAFLRKQIDNIFKSPATGAKSKSKGEVVPLKKKESMYRSPDEFDSRREYEKYLDEVLGPPDDVFGNPMRDQMLENFDKVKAKNVTPKETLAGGIENIKNRMDKIKSASARLDELMKEREEMFKPKNPMRPGGSLDPVQGLTRALARKILDKNAVSIGKKDPIKVFDETFGTDIAIDVKNLAEELLEMERMGKTSKDIDTILKQAGFFDIKIPANPSRGMTDEELEKFIKETEQEKILKDFDPTDRDPNAEGGLTRTSYAMGGGRDTGTIGEMKSKLGVLSNKVRRTSKRLDERGEPDFLEMSRGPVLPEDSTKPINPFVPKPTGPVLPDKMAFDDTPRFELKDIDELINEFEMDNGRRPRSIDDLKRYFYIKYGEDFLAKIDQAITNKSKEIAMKTSNRVQAASGGLAGIINL